MCFMAEMDCVYTHILKQLTAIEPVKSSSLYFEFVLTIMFTRRSMFIFKQVRYIVHTSFISFFNFESIRNNLYITIALNLGLFQFLNQF